METKSVMIVGVGGQGSLLASRILGNVLLAQGYDVKVSEVHGMSQRGGSVVTYVKYGDQVYSPIVEKGEADAIISFELLEAARWVSHLKKDGCLVVSKQQLDPMPVVTGAAQYPDGLLDQIRALSEPRAILAVVAGGLGDVVAHGQEHLVAHDVLVIDGLIFERDFAQRRIEILAVVLELEIEGQMVDARAQIADFILGDKNSFPRMIISC